MILSHLIRSFLNSSYQILSHAPLRRSSRTAASAAFGCGPWAIASSCSSDMLTVETPRRRLSAEVEGRWNSDSLSLYCVHVVSAPPPSSARLRQHEARDPIAAQICGQGGLGAAATKKTTVIPVVLGAHAANARNPPTLPLPENPRVLRGAGGIWYVPVRPTRSRPQVHFSPEYGLL